jgi:succinate dehydrogenase/fumarate reductase flavoprotein subunit
MPIYLDCTAIGEGDLKSNAPLAVAYANLERKKIPMKARKFGVSPYAHFFMGGIRADPNGATNLPGFFAAGEAAGGAQGANRIGGNAFAACIVFGFRAGLAASLHASTVDLAQERVFLEPSSWVTETLNFSGARDAADAKAEIQKIMWEQVGILRSREGLDGALERLNALRGLTLRSVDSAEKFLVPMMLDTAEIMTLSALLREESRGAHCRLDFPEESREWHRKTTLKLCEGRCEVKFVEP